MPSCTFIQGGSEGGADSFRTNPQYPKINQALLAFEALPEGFEWYGWTGECYKCRLEKLPDEVPGWKSSTNSSCAIVSANFPYHIEVRDAASDQVIHKDSFDLGQRGSYLLSAPLDATGSCCSPPKLATTNEGVPSSQIWGPFAVLLAVLAATSAALWWGGACRHPSAEKRKEGRGELAAGDSYAPLPSKGELLAETVESPPPAAPTTTAAATAPTVKPKPPSSRLESLDTFRGMSLTVMIFVNYGGGGYWWLDHSSWEGLTVADLLFPWFMWIMGVSMSLALKSRRSAKETRPQMITQVNSWRILLLTKEVLRRSATLVAIGLFLDAPATLGSWRFPGVLQYFGFSYLWCASAVVLTGSWDGLPGQSAQAAFERQELNLSSPGGGKGFPYDRFLDLRFFWREWPVILVAPSLWLLLTFGVHVPGCGKGYLGPGGRSLEHDHGKDHESHGGDYSECTGGAHRFIDLQVFGHQHLYGEPTCSGAYECKTPYDPEGLVGAFNAVLLTYLGLLAGRSLVYHSSSKACMLRLSMQGTLALALGAALCGCKQHGGLIPVNKNLWSLSFVLVTAGFGCWTLCGLYWLVDHAKLWSGAPFKYTGMNSIVVYAGSEILEGYFPFHVSQC